MIASAPASAPQGGSHPGSPAPDAGIRFETRQLTVRHCPFIDNEALEATDPDLLLLALSDVARAKGMAQVARDAGVGRESFYKALSPGTKPRFETVMKVARALGVKFTAQPA